MREFGHPQLRHGDEVLDVAEASGCGLRLLEQAVHWFDVGVAASAEHAAHDATEVLFQFNSQPLEGLHTLRDLLPFDRPHSQIHEAMRLLLASDARALQIRALRPVHRPKKGMGPAHQVLAHAPPQLAQRLLALRVHGIANIGGGTAHLFATHLVNRPIGQRYGVEVVVGNVGIWPRIADPLGVGCSYVDAGVFDGQLIAAVCAHVLRKGLQPHAMAPRGGTQPAIGLRFMVHVDVFLPALDADLVDPGVAHARHTDLGTPPQEVMAHPTPQALGRSPRLIGRLAHRHFPAQRQAELLEQHGKATALTRHRQLLGPAAARALHLRDLGRQTRFELKDRQVTPVAQHAVVDPLMIGPTRQPRGDTTAGVLDLEVDPPLACAEFDLGDAPRQLQTKAPGEDGLDLSVHAVRFRPSGIRRFKCGFLTEQISFIAPETYTSKGHQRYFLKDVCLMH